MSVQIEDGMEMGHETLCRTAAQTVENSEYSHLQLAEELDVSRGAITRALSETGPKFAKLQRSILEHVTNFEIEERVVFKVVSRE